MRYNISLDKNISEVMDVKAAALGLSRSAYISHLVMKDNGTSSYEYAYYKFRAVIKGLMRTTDFPMGMQNAAANIAPIIGEEDSLPPTCRTKFNHLQDTIKHISARSNNRNENYGSWYNAAKEMDDSEKQDFLGELFDIYSDLVRFCR